MANDNRLFLRDFGVFGETVLVLFGVVFRCFPLVVLFLTERMGVFVGFFPDLRCERTQSDRAWKKMNKLISTNDNYTENKTSLGWSIIVDCK